MYKMIKKCIIRGFDDEMKLQTYYRTKLQVLADVCDMSKSLCINCVGAVDDKREFDTRSVRKDYYLIYMLKGYMEFEYGKENCVMEEGELLVLKPGTHYRNRGEKNSGVNYLWIHFTGYEAEKSLEDFSIPLNRICKAGYSSGLIECWKKICREFVINDEYFSLQTKALLVEFLGILGRLINKGNGGTRLLESVLYIHENYHKKISVSTLADIGNLSEPHYRALFLKNYGKSPVDYITERRIDGVVYLLENTDKTLDEIAALTGFCDAYYMGRQFKKIMGTTPGKYRKNR